jgi:hypothetical protein
MCPGSVMRIDITEEIRSIIMENRIYHLPVKAVVPTIGTVINQTNTVVNFINNMNIFDKLFKFVNHMNTEIIDFESTVESQYKTHNRKFLNDSFRGNVEYKEDNFLDMISDITEAKDIQNINVIYDSTTDRIYFSLGNGEWEKHRLRPGISFLVETLVLFYLKNYEIYIIRKLQTEKGASKTSLETALNTYYKFIGTFDIKPFVLGKNDFQILYNEDQDIPQIESYNIDAHRIVDDCCGRYNHSCTTLTEPQKRATFKEVFDIIKQNNKLNITELNKKILDVLNVDNDFKLDMLGINMIVTSEN